MPKLILPLLLSFSLSTFSQTVNPENIIGRWELTRHTITVKGKSIDKMDSKRTSTYVFSSDGSYQLTERDGHVTIVIKGKWKVADKATKLHLYKSVDVPHEAGVQIADHDLPIKNIGGVHYLTYCYGDTPFGPESDYYEKKDK